MGTPNNPPSKVSPGYHRGVKPVDFEMDAQYCGASHGVPRSLSVASVPEPAALCGLPLGALLDGMGPELPIFKAQAVEVRTKATRLLKNGAAKHG